MHIRAITSAWAAVALLSAWAILPVRIPTSAHVSGADQRQLLIRFQVVTGPDFAVLRGGEAVRAAVLALESPHVGSTDISPYELALCGDMPTSLIDIEHGMYWQTDFVVQGHVVGVTNYYRHAGSKLVPVYFVADWRPTRYVPNFLNRSGWFHFGLSLLPLFAAPILAVGTFISWLRRSGLRSPRGA